MTSCLSPIAFLDCNPHFGPAPTSAPTVEPIDAAQLKQHLQIIDNGEQDEVYRGAIREARERLEREIERALITQTWQLYLDCFPTEPIEVRKCPVQSVTIQYYDTDGTLQTLSSALYRVLTNREPCLIEPAYGESWPATRAMRDAVIVTAVCGYGASPATVPLLATRAIRMEAGYRANTGREYGDEVEKTWERCVNLLRWTAYG